MNPLGSGRPLNTLCTGGTLSAGRTGDACRTCRTGNACCTLWSGCACGASITRRTGGSSRTGHASGAGRTRRSSCACSTNEVGRAGACPGVASLGTPDLVVGGVDVEITGHAHGIVRWCGGAIENSSAIGTGDAGWAGDTLYTLSAIGTRRTLRTDRPCRPGGALRTISPGGALNPLGSGRPLNTLCTGGTCRSGRPRCADACTGCAVCNLSRRQVVAQWVTILRCPADVRETHDASNIHCTAGRRRNIHVLGKRSGGVAQRC